MRKSCVRTVHHYLRDKRSSLSFFEGINVNAKAVSEHEQVPEARGLTGFVRDVLLRISEYATVALIIIMLIPVAIQDITRQVSPFDTLSMAIIVLPTYIVLSRNHPKLRNRWSLYLTFVYPAIVMGFVGIENAFLGMPLEVPVDIKSSVTVFVFLAGLLVYIDETLHIYPEITKNGIEDMAKIKAFLHIH